MPREMLAAALEQIDAIVRPPGDLYFLELRAQTGKLRFLPAMLRSISFGATPAGQPALDAVRHLRSTDGRGPAPSAPLGFVPSGWKRQVKAADGGVDSLGCRLCLLDAMARTCMGDLVSTGISGFAFDLAELSLLQLG